MSARCLLDLVAEGNEDGTALLASLKRDPGVLGLDSLLTEITLADAAVGRPEGTVGAVLYPVVGEKTLRDLVEEAKANEKAFEAEGRPTLRSSCSSYYRQMLPSLLNTLGFKCNNTAYRPVMEALALLAKYAGVDGKTRFYDAADAVPMDGVVRKFLAPLASPSSPATCPSAIPGRGGRLRRWLNFCLCPAEHRTAARIPGSAATWR
ncbi:hypothetical protein [Streptomyces sp. NPDC059262]|uniref:hypothetical protein n=1 Tax=Streptomyces sp. NPDC059262 TaxID=3346797 RepID=UPI0036A194BD